MVAPWKIEEVKKLKELISKYPTVALVSIHGMPAPLMQEFRQKHRGELLIRVAKKNLIERALKELEKEKGIKGISGLMEYAKGEVALVMTDMNAFKLAKLLATSKTPAYAKGGEIAPKDIIVPAGETPFRPGPILSELQSVGLPVSVQRGKIVIKKETVIVKKGEVIPKQVAQVLTRLDIKPLLLGFDLLAAYEDGVVFKPEDLAIDEEAIKAQISEAARNALALAMEIAWPTSETAPLLIQKAFLNAVALVLETGYPVPELMDRILAKAHSQALALASKLPKDALDEEILSAISSQAAVVQVSEEKEEKKEEEKKEEEAEEEKEEEEAIEGLAALFG